MGRLRERLESGQRVVTAELRAIDGASAALVTAALAPLEGRVDAVNVTDNAAARAHASSLAVAALVAAAGVEPIMNLSCRDRNRLALQADLLGAALHGIENVLCVSGDDVASGDQPEAKRVFDLDSVQLLAVAGGLARGRYLSGRELDPAPSLFLGAVENPGAPPFEYRAERALKKVRAGARFFQLQITFDLAPLERFWVAAAGLGVGERAYVLPSVCVVGSARQLRYLAERVPGIPVPAGLVAEVEALPAAAQPARCLELCASLARGMLGLPGVRGLHVISMVGPEGVVALLDRLEGEPLTRERYGDGAGVAV